MRRCAVIWFLVCCVLTTPAMASHDYVLCFPSNFREVNARGSQQPSRLSLSIGAPRASTVRIWAPSYGFDTTMHVSAGSSALVDLPSTLRCVHETGIVSKAVWVQGSEPLSITALDQRFQSTESFTVAPISALGTSYEVSSYTALAADLTGEFCVTATRDNTMLTVTTSPSLRSCDTTQTIYRTLQRGETFVYAAPFIKGQACDPSGMIIRTSAPVSVISGHACAYVPAGNPACNPLYEQLRPIPTLSTTYFIPPIAGRSESMVRIMAPSEPATIKLSNVPDVTIAPSQWYEGRRDASAMLVKSTAPVQVALYSLGYRAGDSVGDPSMIMVPDVNSYAHELMIGTVGTDDWENTITVMCLPNTSNDVRVDGTPVPSSSFITDEASHFRYAHVPVSKGTHIITSAYPIGVMCTGIGVKTNQYDAYGHAGATVLQK